MTFCQKNSSARLGDPILIFHPRRQRFDSPFGGRDASGKGISRAGQDVDKHGISSEAEIRLQRIGSRIEIEIRSRRRRRRRR